MEKITKRAAAHSGEIRWFEKMPGGGQKRKEMFAQDGGMQEKAKSSIY